MTDKWFANLSETIRFLHPNDNVGFLIYDLTEKWFIGSGSPVWEMEPGCIPVPYKNFPKTLDEFEAFVIMNS